MLRSKVRVGDAFVSDDEEELTVLEIDSNADLVIAQDDSGNEVVLGLKDMLADIRAGDLRKVDADESEGEEGEGSD